MIYNKRTRYVLQNKFTGAFLSMEKEVLGKSTIDVELDEYSVWSLAKSYSSEEEAIKERLILSDFHPEIPVDICKVITSTTIEVMR